MHKSKVDNYFIHEDDIEGKTVNLKDVKTKLLIYRSRENNYNHWVSVGQTLSLRSYDIIKSNKTRQTLKVSYILQTTTKIKEIKHIDF